VLSETVREVVGGEFRVSFEEVDRIPEMPNGKLRFSAAEAEAGLPPQ
jgi:hypothetical protein